MSTQSKLNTLLDSFQISGQHQQKITELKDSFNENHVEAFLEKLESLDNFDEIFASPEQPGECSNQLIDFISELITRE